MTIKGQITVQITTTRSMVTGKLSAAMTRYSGWECRRTTKRDLQFRKPQRLQWYCRGLEGAAETLGVPQGPRRHRNNLGGITEASDVSQGS